MSLHWLVILTLVPIACVTMAGLGLILGTSFEPRNIGLMFGFIILPITFLGGTYYPWTHLAPVKVGGFHWLQTLVLIKGGIRLIAVDPRLRQSCAGTMHVANSTIVGEERLRHPRPHYQQGTETGIGGSEEGTVVHAFTIPVIAATL